MTNVDTIKNVHKIFHSSEKTQHWRWTLKKSKIIFSQAFSGELVSINGFIIKWFQALKNFFFC